MTARNLDRILHQPSRIVIVSTLVSFRETRFTRLRELCNLTAGSLAAHLAVLEEAGYIVQREAFIRLRPGKFVAVTPAGKAALDAYISELERLVQDLRGVSPTASTNQR